MNNIVKTKLSKIICILLIPCMLCGCSLTNIHIKKSEDKTTFQSDTFAYQKHTDSAADNEDKIPEPDSVSSKKTQYETIFKSNLNGINGKVSYAFHSYSDNISFTVKSEKVPSASVIKLFIMDYVFNLIEKNELDPCEQIGSRTLDSLVEAMITVSDNTATNVLIDHFGMNNLNEYFKVCGYTDTELQRKMLDFTAQANGKENYTSVNDVLLFLDRIYEKKDVFPQKDMIEMMKRQTVCTKIRRDLPTGTVIANKTGELSNVENDAGIIFADNSDFAVVFMTSHLSDTSYARRSIANTTRVVFDEVNK